MSLSATASGLYVKDLGSLDGSRSTLCANVLDEKGMISALLIFLVLSNCFEVVTYIAALDRADSYIIR